MFNNHTDYARNKFEHDAIVYCNTFGEIIRLTSDDFESEEEFQKWKSWSDTNYYTDDRGDVVNNKHCVSIDGLLDTTCPNPSVDAKMICQDECADEYRDYLTKIAQIRGCMSETQFRRLWLHEAECYRLVEIAEMEGVSATAVFYSLEAAQKKIKKCFPDNKKST